jgi:hypothetical protein
MQVLLLRRGSTLMSALRAKPTVSVTEWANEQGWRKLRVLLICRSTLLLNCKWANAAAMALVGCLIVS